MIKHKSKKDVCDFSYLSCMMGRKKHLILRIMDLFLKEIPEELRSLKNAIKNKDYPAIRSLSHIMKSSVAIMGISTLKPVLQQMEDICTITTGPDSLRVVTRREEKIKKLNQKLRVICRQALEEVQKINSTHTGLFLATS